MVFKEKKKSLYNLKKKLKLEIIEFNNIKLNIDNFFKYTKPITQADFYHIKYYFIPLVENKVNFFLSVLNNIDLKTDVVLLKEYKNMHINYLNYLNMLYEWYNIHSGFYIESNNDLKLFKKVNITTNYEYDDFLLLNDNIEEDKDSINTIYDCDYAEKKKKINNLKIKRSVTSEQRKKVINIVDDIRKSMKDSLNIK